MNFNLAIFIMIATNFIQALIWYFFIIKIYMAFIDEQRIRNDHYQTNHLAMKETALNEKKAEPNIKQDDEETQ